MSYIICSLPHSGTRALVAHLARDSLLAPSDFRGVFDRQGHAYVFNPGHAPFWGHPEKPYLDWLSSAPYPLLVPVRPLADIARSWLRRTPDGVSEAARLTELLSYLDGMRYVTERRAVVPVSMCQIVLQGIVEAPRPVITSEWLDGLEVRAHNLLGHDLHWPMWGAQ